MQIMSGLPVVVLVAATLVVPFRTCSAQEARQEAEPAEQERIERQRVERLLTNKERDRVNTIRETLKEKGFGGLTRRDIEFAAYGYAAPVLRDELLEAAKTWIPSGSIGYCARILKFSPRQIVLAFCDRDQIIWSRRAGILQRIVDGDQSISRDALEPYREDAILQATINKYADEHENIPGP